jgi:hypothetical protein
MSAKKHNPFPPDPLDAGLNSMTPHRAQQDARGQQNYLIEKWADESRKPSPAIGEKVISRPVLESLYTADEVLAALSLNSKAPNRYIERLCRKAGLQFYKINGRVLLNYAQYEKILEQHQCLQFANVDKRKSGITGAQFDVERSHSSSMKKALELIEEKLQSRSLKRKHMK